MTEELQFRFKICPACDTKFQEDLVVCPYDRTMLLTPVRKTDSLLGKIGNWIDGPFLYNEFFCENCGEEGINTRDGRCNKDQGRYIRKRKTFYPPEPPLIDERYKLVKFSHLTKLTECILGIDTKTGEQIYFELLLRDHSLDPKTVSRIESGSTESIKLDHPGIQKIYSVDYLEKGNEDKKPQYLYIISEPIPAFSLREKILKEDRLSEDYVKKLFKQICKALEYAHAKDMFHGNFASENVVLDEQAEELNLKIKGFGIAERLFRELEWDGTQNATKTANIYGFIGGIAPELMQGIRPNATSDVYAVGSSMYECLTGCIPHKKESDILTLLSRFKDSPEPFSPDLNISEAFEAVIFKCLQKDPANRFNSISELSEAIKSLQL